MYSPTLRKLFNDVYKIKFGNLTIFHFFPDSFYNAFHLHHHLAKGMSFHFTFMWLFALNGLLYVVFLFITNDFRNLIPDKRSFKEAWLVVLHDLHLRKKLPEQVKYNAAQRIAYAATVIMGILIILSGLAIYKPIQFHGLRFILGGYEMSRVEHFTFTLVFCLFFLIHIVQVIIAGWNNFRGMLAGFEVRRISAESQKEIPENRKK